MSSLTRAAVVYVALLCVSSPRWPVVAVGTGVTEQIAQLNKLVAESQIKHDSTTEPFSHKQFGVYPSNIRLNFFGGPAETYLRREFRVFDNNGFVTEWITCILLEVTRFTDGPRPTDKQLLDALKALSTYHDKNRPKNSSVMTFWPETFNSTTKSWVQGPVNLMPMVQDYKIFEAEIIKLLKIVHLENLWYKYAKFLDQFAAIAGAFYIPADFDDTAVNIGLGSLLKQYSSVSSEPYQQWKLNNPSISEVIPYLKRYAYRPFSQEQDSNSIDPRTYFYAREFLLQASEPLALIPTWIQNISEDRQYFDKKYRMPMNINNVDLTVSSNVVYGLTAAVLAQLEGSETWFDDPDLQMIYENTSSLLAWEIERNFSNRMDLALTYYPSEYSFYWFTARTVNLLNSADELPISVMVRVRDILTKALRDSATMAIVKSGTKDGEYVYFDGFLGNADKNVLGKPVSHGEDRIYSTAMAVNALLYTWTERGRLVADTPAMVTDTATRACKWLLENSLSGKYKPYNAFFSGSIKTEEQLPFFFPGNLLMFLNGTSLPPNRVLSNNDTDIIVAVSGVIPEDQYQQKLKEKQFGYITPQVFHGFNLDAFPFWSSEPMTHASTMLALTQFKTLLGG